MTGCWRHIFVLASALLVAGCGFRAMYAAPPSSPGTEHAAVAAELSFIEVAPIPDRLGQIVRNGLQDRLTPKGPDGDLRYRLELTLLSEREGFGFRPDESITRENLRVTAQYRLVDIGSEEVLVRGTASSNMAYDVVQSDFANFTAARDAESRTAEQVVQTIVLRLGLHFQGERNNEAAR